MNNCILQTGKRKFWLAIAAIFVFGAFTSNFAWLIYSGYKDDLYMKRITKIEASYKYQMGQQRTKIESKIDEALNILKKEQPSPVIIDVRSTLEEVKNAE